MESSFAQKEMARMGWKKGQGLGKRKQGRASHVGVQKREDGVGLGARPDAKGAGKSAVGDEWWSTAFGAALDNVNKTKTKPADLDDLFKATGGTRLGMRARHTKKRRRLA